jgi:FkbM family methyltransferase
MAIQKQVPGILVEATLDGVGVRFFVRNMVDDVQHFHLNGQFYESEALALMRQYLPRGGVFLDVGANVGNHALYMEKFGDAGEVICIEPNPDAITLLRINAALNSATRLNLQHLGVGLAEAEGRFAMNVPRNNLGAAQLVPSASGGIRTLPGDRLLGERAVDFIKIDVEGMELGVLRGLAGAIARSRPPIFVEVDHDNRAAFDAWRGENRYTVVKEMWRAPKNQNLLIAPDEAPEPRR